MITWQYIAGFLDGDGWITMSARKPYPAPTIGFTQHSRTRVYMMEIAEFLQFNNVIASVRDRRVMGSINKETIMINVMVREQRSVALLLENIIPYLLFKRDKAEECLKFVRDRIAKRGIEGADCLQSTNHYWKPSEIEELLRLQSEGYSNRAIAKLLNRSTDSISHKLNRLKVVRCSPQACHGTVLVELSEQS